ncbi:hypothetical protein Phi4:1_gp140 [Cellulophaga phage phi4:1]|uniref:Uncharacterized protein n=3 Tax=Lightbulbvirus Cba41 TaxID=1918524 RepID=A0A0S2MWR9_9CAUD|nr:hypothetical protein Phi4:1_gp140 [Cellulophaga phage phi4:1]AGO49553.1 hypothetical protein Phi4:1_gp140 [Cellulophaga phage phi4:1]ALO80149.1 hypothetical protein Phi4113_140 [Cellulophaga phage phi4:1_13]ALO80346.1 hypothetical protein Phi4118_140 [Cellulophaga phage phi4:1_18]
MTQEQQKILAQISTDTILYFLREVRCTAIQIWQPLDVIGKAKEMGFEITEEQAIDIIADIRKNKDCVIGITWDTIENHIEDLIIKNSFTLNTVESGEVKFCSLETNDEVGNYWDDDSFGYYGLTKEQILNGECESFTVKKEKAIVFMDGYDEVRLAKDHSVIFSTKIPETIAEYFDRETIVHSVIDEVVSIWNETEDLSKVDNYLLDEGECTQEEREVITEMLYKFFTVKKELTKERVKEEMELHNNDEAGINNQWTYEDAEYHLLLSDEFYKN